MKLSTKGRYAVMAMVDLAIQSTENKPVALAEIAERQEITKRWAGQECARTRWRLYDWAPSR